MKFFSTMFRRGANNKIICPCPYGICEDESPPKDSAVSPVIGIMLMLIVTVILAAIISGYVGGMSETKTKPPQLVLQTEACLDNDSDLNVTMAVISAGDGIPTKDLKIITAWAGDKGNTTFGSIGQYPYGLGPGVGEKEGSQHFGNYTLLGGTRMIVNSTESRKTFFGDDFEELKEGDPISIKFIYIPSQCTIYNQELIIGDC